VSSIQLADLLFLVCRMFLSFWNLRNSSLFSSCIYEYTCVKYAYVIYRTRKCTCKKSTSAVRFNSADLNPFLYYSLNFFLETS
jgi:hypothetical protein